MYDEEELEIAEVRRKWEAIRRTEELLSEGDESPQLRYAVHVVEGMVAMWIITMLVWMVGMQV